MERNDGVLRRIRAASLGPVGAMLVGIQHSNDIARVYIHTDAKDKIPRHVYGEIQ